MRNAEQHIAGHALVGEDLALAPVDIFIENGIITAIEDNPKVPQVWIRPAFFNAHTHLGDTIAMDCGVSGDLAELVTPPYGLKHRLLAAVSREDLVAGMRASVEGMIAGGTAGCADFREGGEEGVAALREAVVSLPFRSCIFGRNGGDRIAEGLGISSVRDSADAEKQVREAKLAGKKIAFHAGERDPDDVDAAIAFEPDLIIHATHATRKQLRECAERGIIIAVCPRSNWMLGVTSSGRHPPLALMESLGCRFCLGTDNVMFVGPDMSSELAFTSIVYPLSPRTLLQAAIRGSEIAGLSFFIRTGGRANLVTIDPARNSLRFSRDQLTSLVKRAPFASNGKNVFNL
jgi:cytosine/adenosine deaminase-related metal-dependent hydrolase